MSVPRTYHHFGIRTLEDVPGADWIDLGLVKITNPNKHPLKLEYVWHLPGSYDPNVPLKPHIAYTVDDIEAAVEGKEIIDPIHPVPFGLAAFTLEDGIEVEYLQLAPGRAWFDDEV